MPDTSTHMGHEARDGHFENGDLATPRDVEGHGSHTLSMDLTLWWVIKVYVIFSSHIVILDSYYF